MIPPSPESNLQWLLNRSSSANYDQLHRWSIQNREEYWKAVIERLGLQFRRPFSRVLDLTNGVASPKWLPDARLNIVESCFLAPDDSPAILHQSEAGPIETISVGELRLLTARVASNLARIGIKPGDPVAIFMPMTAESVAIYLGIIHAGAAVVGIADSFRPKEIEARVRLAGAVAIFTQDVALRAGKELPLYEHVKEANAPRAIILPAAGEVRVELREADLRWSEFLADFPWTEPIERSPEDPVNILFSSGTTGDPKVIPWTQTTPIKCAADAHFHQEVRPGDVLVWPTNIGWMMGPWLIFASLLNRAAMGLFAGAPTTPEFCKFVQDSHATLLGVVPSIVKAWRRGAMTAGLNWSTLRAFSSTGECSTPDDMQWLMDQAGGKPVIEYCGGTEIGGGYITGTMARACLPGTFNTPALGLDFVILNEAGEASKEGEVFLLPPSIGLSNSLLNHDHHTVYYAGTPKGPHGEVLRRHGDQMEQLVENVWRGLGRADDTMNLGGIKVSSAEIERVIQRVPGVVESAAIAVAPGGGPSLLVICAVVSDKREGLAAEMQQAIKRDLNPLFKIHEVVFVEALPRTASNKVMRRTLRDQYLAKT